MELKMKNKYSIYYNDEPVQNFSNEEEMVQFIINNNNNKIPYRFIAIGRNLYLLVFHDPRFFCTYEEKRYAPRFVIKKQKFFDGKKNCGIIII